MCYVLLSRWMLNNFIVLGLLLFSMPVIAKMQQTTWHPDTCDGCVVVYEWDDTVSQELRTHTVVEVTNEPIDFKNETKEIKYDKILEENQRKNIAVGEIIKNNSALIDVDGNLKKDVRI